MVKLYLFYAKTEIRNLFDNMKVELYAWTDKKEVCDIFLKERNNAFYKKVVELEKHDYKKFLKKNLQKELNPVQITKKISIYATKDDELNLHVESEYLVNELEAIHSMIYDTRLKKKYQKALNYLCCMGTDPKMDYFKIFYSLYKDYLNEEAEQ